MAEQSEHDAGRETVFAYAARGVATWLRLIEMEANGALGDERALDDMTAELFDATPVVAVLAALSEGNQS